MPPEFNSAEEILSSWATLSPEAQQWMKDLGGFGPTYHGEVKGVDTDGYKTYWSADDLRQCAKAMVEVAEWLESRKKA